jgi:hypothetical protein
MRMMVSAQLKIRRFDSALTGFQLISAMLT